LSGPGHQSQERREYPPIKDYAIIGDCRCAALISRGGSIDWLCMPRFDSPSIFSAILDIKKGGHFSIRPVEPFQVQRRYLEGTNVLETVFTTSGGKIRLIDLMPIYTREDRRHEFTPERQLFRSVFCDEGEVEVDIHFAPRPDYSRQNPLLTERGKLGIYSRHEDHLILLRSEFPFVISQDKCSASCRCVLKAGESRSISLSFSQDEPAVIPVLGREVIVRIEKSIQWWRDWLSTCQYEGPYIDAVLRSILVLKLLTYAPSGAVVAAPTTSLPEKIGGIRNWDYRYCWLRDASMTLRAFFRLGYENEGKAFLSWMLHSTRLRSPHLQIVHNVYGEVHLKEQELRNFDGYRGSRPVRIGNKASEQLQLDVYGEVIEAAYEFVRKGGVLDGPSQRMIKGFGRAICQYWHEPDESIWEIRGKPRHHTYSKVLCWVGLDRLVKLQEQGIMKVPKTFSEERDKIREEIERCGFSKRLNSYISRYDDEEVDTSLLLLPIYDYSSPDNPKIKSTYERIYRELGTDGLFYRFKKDFDGLPAGEGAFAICSFWAIESLARAGAVEAAAKKFEQLLSYANDVGLYAEEIDPENGEALGNFPQAFTHVGLINAAATIAERMEQDHKK
jgi:GH15 family glucan-1,4-alpha-glucosidase